MVSVVQLVLAFDVTIRDTSYYSYLSDPRLVLRNIEGWRTAQVYVRSTLDQPVQVQISGLAYGVDPTGRASITLPYPLADVFYVDAGSSADQVEVRAISEEYMPTNLYIRVYCPTAPTSGRLDAWVEVEDAR